MKKILSTVAAAAVLTTGAMAADISDKGNYLVSPIFFATDGGYTTDVKVYNTRNDKAVIAKVVIREAKCSQELKDFLIFLSPGDAFEATISVVDGNVVVTSTDDSVDTGTYADGGKTTTSAAALLKAGVKLLDGSRFANTKVYNLGSTTQKGTINANAGYVEVFSLIEIEPTKLDTSWEVKTPLAKSKMVAFYDTVSKAQEKKNEYSDTTKYTYAIAPTTLGNTEGGMIYGTRAKNFVNFVPVPNSNYNTYMGLLDAQVTKYDIDAILATDVGADGTAGTADDKADGYINQIDPNLLTGTLTVKNATSGKEAAMTTTMYAQNLTGLTNRIFGERQVETNYMRVLSGDYQSANTALRDLTNQNRTNNIYIPYEADKPSLLNTLFIAKNQSNYKCTFDTTDYTKAVSKATRRPIALGLSIRDMEENINEAVTTESPISGIYKEAVEVDALYPEVGQINVGTIVTDTNKKTGKDFKKGWITVTLSESDDDKEFAYDVDESLDPGDAGVDVPLEHPSIDATSTAVVGSYNNGESSQPAILPTYMQVMEIGSTTYTNMYRPARD